MLRRHHSFIFTQMPCCSPFPPNSHAHYTANPATPPPNPLLYVTCMRRWAPKFWLQFAQLQILVFSGGFSTLFSCCFPFFSLLRPILQIHKKKTKKRANVNHSQDGSRSSKNVVKDLTSIGTTTCFGHISRMPSSSSSSSSPETTATIDGVGWWK